jgi:hypothetical protein
MREFYSQVHIAAKRAVLDELVGGLIEPAQVE